MTTPEDLPPPDAIDPAPRPRYPPYPAYKHSGVPWLGEIPAGWEVINLKYLARFIYGESLPGNMREGGTIPVYGSNGIVDRHTIANTLAPCLIIGRKGSYGKVNYSNTPCFAIDTTFYIDSRSTNADIRWLYYSLPLLGLDSFSQDSTIPGLSREYAYNQKMPFPPPPEQRAIAAYLDQETAKLDTLIAKVQHGIALLREYRTALISAAVTGAIDVREHL